MIQVHHVLAGVLLGAAGALAHLALTGWRARLVTSGRRRLAAATFPVGLALIAASVVAASSVAPAAAWATVVGILATRAAWLGRRVKELP